MPYKIAMSVTTDPKKQIQALGERGIDVPVVDPESGVMRLIKVNPFDPQARSFQGSGGIVEVCNAIKKELNTQPERATGRSIPRPAIAPEVAVEKEKSHGDGMSLT